MFGRHRENQGALERHCVYLPCYVLQLAGQENLVQGLKCWFQVAHAFQRFGGSPGDPATRTLFLNACNQSDPNIFLSTQARYCQPDGKRAQDTL